MKNIIRIIQLIILILFITSCRSAKDNIEIFDSTQTEQPGRSILKLFEDGDLRFGCESEYCITKLSEIIKELDEYVKQKDYIKLVEVISSASLNMDVSYYYLGLAAEGINRKDIADIYFVIAKHSKECTTVQCKKLKIGSILKDPNENKAMKFMNDAIEEGKIREKLAKENEAKKIAEEERKRKQEILEELKSGYKKAEIKDIILDGDKLGKIATKGFHQKQGKIHILSEYPLTPLEMHGSEYNTNINQIPLLLDGADRETRELLLTTHQCNFGCYLKVRGTVTYCAMQYVYGIRKELCLKVKDATITNN